VIKLPDELMHRPAPDVVLQHFEKFQATEDSQVGGSSTLQITQ
jgi:hypothetical protein